jgi:hypothetical protein
MDVQFREFNPFDCWIWLEFDHVLAPLEQQYIDETFDSWFYLGKLGAFNAENLQAQEEGLDLSYMTYDQARAASSLLALMHNMGDVEYQGRWARCWFDLGTSDALALDVLINAFQQLNKELLEIKTLIVGGENSDWPAPGRQREGFVDASSEYN